MSEDFAYRIGLYSPEELKTLNSRYRLNTLKLIEEFEGGEKF